MRGAVRSVVLRILPALLTAALVWILSSAAGAEEYRFRAQDAGSGAVRDAWDAFREALPEEAEKLRDVDLSDPLSAAETVRSAVLPENLWERLRTAFLKAAERVVPEAAPLFGLLLLCASVRYAVPAGAMEDGMARVMRLAAAVTVFRLAGAALSLADRVAGTVCRLAELMIPVTEGICLLGGGVTEGRVARVGLMLAVTAAEEAAGSVLIPAAGCVLGLTAVSGGKGVAGSAAGALRKLLLRAWQSAALLLTFLLGAQSVLARTADSAGMRLSRFALSSFVPVAGSALSDAWSSVTAGIRVLRGTAGIGGIIALGAVSLPAVIALLLWQAVFALAHGVSDALGLKELSPLLEQAGGIASLLSAFALYTLAMFVVQLALFAGLGTA